VHLISAEAVESWPAQSKDDVARELVARAARFLADHCPADPPLTDHRTGE
jgi:hypothetical protein